MSDRIQLRACPFCGNEKLNIDLANHRYLIGNINCNCGAEVTLYENFKVDKRKTEAKQITSKIKQAENLNIEIVNKWNTRAKNI